MTTRRAGSIAVLTLGAVLASVPSRAQDTDAGEASPRETRHALRRAVQPLFDDAAREFGVPADVLRAYAFVHTRWSITHRAKREPGHMPVGSSRVDLQACKLEYSIVSPK